jgi:predicted nucleotidyltransferase
MDTLEKILSSKARASFFYLLFGIDFKEIHLREIQRRSGMAIETIRKEANKLESLDLVIKRKDGNRTYYKANKNHPLYDEIHKIVLKTAGLRDVLLKALNVDQIKFAFVFGSIANGNANSESDIDLFIIGDIGLRNLSKLIKESSQKLGREINPHTMNIKEFIKRKRDGEHFVTQVYQSPKLMIIGLEDELTGLV